MGERAEISKDRLYESKDSLEILNGSSLSIARWLVVVLVELLDLVDQKFLRSVGEGGRYTPLSLISLSLYSVASLVSIERGAETLRRSAWSWASTGRATSSVRRKGFLMIGMAGGFVDLCWAEQYSAGGEMRARCGGECHCAVVRRIERLAGSALGWDDGRAG